MSETLISRRDALKLTAGALMAATTQRTARKVIVAGAGIGGLSCAWELVRRGHEVVVLEAADRTGGHVFTFRQPLDDGLYADAGAEHFTQPGYERYWSYVKEFELPHRYYPRRENILRFIGGKMYTAEMLADPKVLAGFGLNRREIEYIEKHTFPELAGLYYAPYLDNFRDEYRPFDAGLNHLDQVSTADLFRKDGASAGALQFIGGGSSALYSVWHAAILKLRGVPLFPPRVYRLVGGNQKLPDAFVERLGARIRLGLAGDPHRARADRRAGHERVRQGQHDPRSGLSRLRDVRGAAAGHSRRPRLAGRQGVGAAERAVLFRLARDLPVAHAVLETRRHQPEHGVRGPGVEPRVDAPATRCETSRGLLVGTATGVQTPEAALAMFRKRYPGKSEDIEKAHVVAWASNPWASACETTSYRPGQLARFWPTLIEPHGRIHFVGAYADNLNWGMEAATRSAYRVSEAIDKA